MDIEGYEIGECLRREGPTTLFRGRQLSLDRPVVVEILDEAAGTRPAVREAFAVECRRLSGLLHPHLVSGLACGEVDGRPYLVTEDVGGESLERVVAAEGRLDEERALRIGAQLAAALAYLEQVGLIHGEVSPAVVLLSEEGVAKLDRIPAVREPGWKGRDRAGHPVGARGYRGPEARTGRVPDLDHRWDLHALGGVLYFMLAGVSPAEDAVEELRRGRMIERPVALQRRRSDLARVTLRLISGLMAPEPEDRIPDSVAAVRRIEEAITSLSVRTLVKPGRGRRRRSRRRRRR